MLSPGQFITARLAKAARIIDGGLASCVLTIGLHGHVMAIKPTQPVRDEITIFNLMDPDGGGAFGVGAKGQFLLVARHGGLLCRA